MRATLNGKDGFTPSSYAGAETCLTGENCLLSCFPDDLRSLINARTYTVPTSWSTDRSCEISDSTEVSDKLRLPNATEAWGFALDTAYKDFCSQFYKKIYEGATESSYGRNKVFNEAGEASTWLLRSPCRYSNVVVAGGSETGSCTQYGVKTELGALTPCFCL